MGTPLIYDIDFEVAAIAFLVIVNIFLRVRYTAETEVNREFRKLALYVLLACLLDVATAVTISYGDRIPPGINLLFNTVYVGMDIVVGFQFMQYISAYIYKKKQGKGYRFNNIFCHLCFLALIVNLFTGIIFSFDSEGNYMHGPLYIFVYAVPYYYIIFSIGIMFFHFKIFGIKQRISIIALFVFGIVGPLAQLLFSRMCFSVFSLCRWGCWSACLHWRHWITNF